MADAINGIHPTSAELQAHADGEAGDERVLAHLGSCATCREEVAAIRRVTAALSLGSAPPDSLTERIQSRRAEIARSIAAATKPSRSRRDIRRFALPAGLAAAAALAIFVPRALREPALGEGPTSAGAKGAVRGDVVISETIVTETGSTSLDSISWEFSGLPTARVALSYVGGVAESGQAERLAARVAGRLRAAGIADTQMTIDAASASAAGSLPPGAVRVTIRARVAPAP